MATKMGLPGMDLMKGVGIGPLNIGNVLDTMGFVKKAWGAMNAPSSFMPTMDVEELNKRIVDLQAVEQWLMMNLSMIQGSIQALEVQRATIETLKGVTRGMLPGNLNMAFAAPEPAKTSDLPKLPTGYSFSPVAAPAPAPELPAAPPRPKRAAKAPGKTAQSKAAVATDPGLSATAWLEFLQGQFNQVAQAAMSGSPLTAAAKSVAKAAGGAVTGAVARAPAKVAAAGASAGTRKKAAAPRRKSAAAR